MEILGNIIGLLVFGGAMYFMYTKIKASRERKRGTGSGSRMRDNSERR